MFIFFVALFPSFFLDSFSFFYQLEVDSTVLIESQIGAAVHVLFKHKAELPANKKLCQALIAKWSRPIFNVPSNYTALKEIEPMTPDTPPTKR